MRIYLREFLDYILFRKNYAISIKDFKINVFILSKYLISESVTFTVTVVNFTIRKKNNSDSTIYTCLQKCFSSDI